MLLILQIAWRFLLAKKRAMLMSLAGIVIGVAFFIVAQAQTGGFEALFIRTVWSANGALRVQVRIQSDVVSMMAEGGAGDGFAVPLREGRSYVVGVEHPDRVMEAVQRFGEVAGASEVLRGKVGVKSGFREEEGEAFGIRPEEYMEVSAIGSQIRYGSLDEFSREPQSIMIGTRLAERLRVDVGAIIYLRTLHDSRRYRIAGIFETGVEDYDKRRVFVHLREARLLLDEPDKVTFIQVSLFDNSRADVVARHMEDALGHDVRPWQENERTWLEIFRLLRITSGITMGAIIAIAALGMFNTLAIVVMERRREIAILRSMGYSKRDISGIFLGQGAIVLAVGLAGGCILAVLLTLGIENLPLRIRGVLTADNIVIEWSAWHYAKAALVATVSVLVASYLPARKAAKVEPGEIIRGAS